MLTVELEIPRLHEKQRLVRAQAKRFNALNCGRRWGKTTLGIDILADDLLKGFPCAWFSPTYKMLSDVWREVVEVFQPATKTKSEQEHRIELITGGVLDMWSLDSPDSSRGRRYHLVIVDEAAMVRDLWGAWNAVIRPTLIDLTGNAWFFSTPKGRNGFYQIYNMGRDPHAPDWKSWTFSSYDNPHIPASELDAMREGESEQHFRQEILAEFVEDSGQVFRNIAANLLAPASTPEAHAEHTIVAGVDWGKQQDFTAISVGCVDCMREVARDRFNQIDWEFQRGRLKVLFDAWHIHAILVEQNSIGDPQLEALGRDGYPVMGFQTTPTSKAPLIENLALALERTEWQFQPDAVWTGELEAYERKVSAITGRSQYNAPEGMHDDTVIARALMVRAANSINKVTIAFAG